MARVFLKCSGGYAIILRYLEGGMSMISRNAWVEINLAAVEHNVRENKSLLAPGVKLCAVVKANAYGHGAVPIAQRALQVGADFLAVALTQEAVELREAGIKAPILILGTMPKGHGDTILEYNISQAVYSIDKVKELSQAAVRSNKKAKIHLAIETGMNRIGIAPENLPDLVETILELPNVEIEGVFSHFATADMENKEFTEQQFVKFQEAINILQQMGVTAPLRHIANSAGINEIPHMHLDMVRQGITLYGMWPSNEVEHHMDIKPVMQIKARINHLKWIKTGETVGYGRTYTATSPRHIATLSIGYADGISRQYSNRGYVVLHGRKAPVVGRVCMDQMMVDVTDIPDVELEDEAIVLGCDELTVETVAEWMNTINYEVTCLITNRLPRKYID